MLRTHFALSFVVACAAATQLKAVTIWGVDSNNRAGGDSVVKFDSQDPVHTIVSIGHTGVLNTLMSGLDFDASGNLYACSAPPSGTGSFYRIDQTNGHATLIGAMNLAGATQQITDLTYNL